MYCRNRTFYENFNLKFYTCAQSHVLGTRANFRFAVLTLNVITGIVNFREIILESSQNISLTKVSRALKNILSKFVYCRNCTSDENFKLKLCTCTCTCTQSHALDTRSNFQQEILTINVIFGIVYFREIILYSSRNFDEISSWLLEALKTPVLVVSI